MSNTLGAVIPGALLGGTTMSILSAAGAFVLEKKQPTPKTLARDFILGAILLLLILQILPESTGKLISYVTSFATVPAFATVTSMASAAAAATSSTDLSAQDGATPIDDMEVKVGVPRF
jgi:hypothetical protein